MRAGFAAQLGKARIEPLPPCHAAVLLQGFALNNVTAACEPCLNSDCAVCEPRDTCHQCEHACICRARAGAPLAHGLAAPHSHLGTRPGDLPSGISGHMTHANYGADGDLTECGTVCDVDADGGAACDMCSLDYYWGSDYYWACTRCIPGWALVDEEYLRRLVPPPESPVEAIATGRCIQCRPGPDACAVSGAGANTQ